MEDFSGGVYVVERQAFEIHVVYFLYVALVHAREDYVGYSSAFGGEDFLFHAADRQYFSAKRHLAGQEK